jgi:hypothetical protein
MHQWCSASAIAKSAAALNGCGDTLPTPAYRHRRPKMISVDYECDFPGCDAGNPEDQQHRMTLIPAGDSVDVYLDNWKSGAKLSGYLPEGWTVQLEAEHGLVVVWCPAHLT